MISEPLILSDRHRPPFNGQFIQLLDVRTLGLTVEQVFDPGRFRSGDLHMEGWTIQLWLVRATDGLCWAELTGSTDNGRAILAPMVQPQFGDGLDVEADETKAEDRPRRRGRPPKTE